jgi:uncharacterized protein
MKDDSPIDSPAPAIIPGTHVFWGYQDLVLFGGAMLPSILLGTAVGRIARSLFGADKGVESLILQFVAFAGWFLALFFLFRVRYGKPFWESLGWNPRPARMIESFFEGIAVSVGLIFVSAFLDKPPGDSPMQELLSRESTLLLVGVFSVTLGPLCEELAFRGFLMPLFAQSFGVAAAIVLAAIPFAIAHAPQYAYSWRHVALIGLAGMAFGWNRYKTGSTAATTVMHGSYNLVIFCGLLYERYRW